MGVDLRMLPFDAEGAVNFSHTVLDIARRRELWEPISEIELQFGRDVPENFISFLCVDGEGHYGLTLKTAYGVALKYVPIGYLKALKNHPCVTDNHKNRAVWAYLEQLSDATKVALYWH